MDVEWASHKVYGDVVEGDLVLVNVQCLVRIDHVQQSNRAPGMRHFSGVVVNTPERDSFDCGVLVDTEVYREVT